MDADQRAQYAPAGLYTSADDRHGQFTMPGPALLPSPTLYQHQQQHHHPWHPSAHPFAGMTQPAPSRDSYHGIHPRSAIPPPTAAVACRCPPEMDGLRCPPEEEEGQQETTTGGGASRGDQWTKAEPPIMLDGRTGGEDAWATLDQLVGLGVESAVDAPFTVPHPSEHEELFAASTETQTDSNSSSEDDEMRAMGDELIPSFESEVASPLVYSMDGAFTLAGEVPFPHPYPPSPFFVMQPQTLHAVAVPTSPMVQDPGYSAGYYTTAVSSAAAGERPDASTPFSPAGGSLPETSHTPISPSSLHSVGFAETMRAVAPILPTGAGSSSTPAAAAGAPKQPPAPAVKPVAKKACVACRALKASCDDQRPCSRCVKFCRECVDRTEEEVEQAKARRTRVPTPASALAAVSAPKARSRKKVASGAGGTAGGANHANNAKKRSAPTAGRASGADALVASKPSALATPAMVPSLSRHLADLAPSAYAANSATTDAVSSALWSRSFLAALIKLGLRDSILATYSELHALPVHLSAHLHWTMQVSVLMSHICDCLIPEDVGFFLLDGLTQAQIDSPVWANSPLAPWVKLSTRPLHIAVQPSVAGHHREQTQQHPHPQASSDLLDSMDFLMTSPSGDAHPPLDDSVPQLSVELLPASQTAYQRWQQMHASKTVFDWESRASRCAPSALEAHGDPAAVGGESQMMSPVVASQPIDVALSCANLRSQLLMNDESTSSTVSASSADVGVSSSGVEAAAAVDDIESIITDFGCLDIVRALSEPRGTSRPEDIVRTVHASWCPLGQPAVSEAWQCCSASVGQGEDGGAHAQHCAKRARKEGDDSVYSAADLSVGATAASNSSPLVCLCSLSTALPMRVVVNPAFERVFGVARREVEVGFATEGWRWTRRFHPPSVWQQLHQDQIAHMKMLIDYIGQLSIANTRAAMGVLAVSSQPLVSPACCSPSVSLSSPGSLSLVSASPSFAPDFVGTIPTHVITRGGRVARCELTKCGQSHCREPDRAAFVWGFFLPEEEEEQQQQQQQQQPREPQSSPSDHQSDDEFFV